MILLDNSILVLQSNSTLGCLKLYRKNSREHDLSVAAVLVPHGSSNSQQITRMSCLGLSCIFLKDTLTGQMVVYSLLSVRMGPAMGQSL